MGKFGYVTLFTPGKFFNVRVFRSSETSYKSLFSRTTLRRDFSMISIKGPSRGRKSRDYTKSKNLKTSAAKKEAKLDLSGDCTIERDLISVSTRFQLFPCISPRWWFCSSHLLRHLVAREHRVATLPPPFLHLLDLGWSCDSAVHEKKPSFPKALITKDGVFKHYGSCEPKRLCDTAWWW